MRLSRMFPIVVAGSAARFTEVQEGFDKFWLGLHWD